MPGPVWRRCRWHAGEVCSERGALGFTLLKRAMSFLSKKATRRSASGRTPTPARWRAGQERAPASSGASSPGRGGAEHSLMNSGPLTKRCGVCSGSRPPSLARGTAQPGLAAGGTRVRVQTSPSAFNLPGPPGFAMG